MVEKKQRRVGTAVGFLFGVLACLNAMRDARIFWPPEALWKVLSRPQRLQLVAGIALIAVTLMIRLFRQRDV